LLKMVTIESIRKMYLREGRSIRDISRTLGVSRQSVRRVIYGEVKRSYTMSEPRTCPVMDPHRELILAWLKDDQEAPPKQRHTARRVFTRLRDEYGFEGAESTVRRYLARLRNSRPEVFIPLTADPAEVAEVDWGTVWALINGERRQVHLFVMRMRYSGVCFARAYPFEKSEAFFDGHVQAFQWFGGVVRSARYDNIKTAVLKILLGPMREENPEFSALRAHYLFDSIFCAPGKGNEKGGVENGIGYVRRNALVPLPNVESLVELNATLLAWCDKDRGKRAQPWIAEHDALMPLPQDDFKCSTTHLLRVNKLSLVHFERNRYSVPTAYAHTDVRLEAFVDRVEILHKDKLIAVHPRALGRNHDELCLDHYLDEIQRKKRSVMHASVVRNLSPVHTEFLRRLNQQGPTEYRKFAEILLLHRRFSSSVVEEALARAMELCNLEVSVVHQLALSISGTPPTATVEVPAELAAAVVSVPDLSEYDALGGGMTAW